MDLGYLQELAAPLWGRVASATEGEIAFVSITLTGAVGGIGLLWRKLRRADDPDRPKRQEVYGAILVKMLAIKKVLDAQKAVLDSEGLVAFTNFIDYQENAERKSLHVLMPELHKFVEDNPLYVSEKMAAIQAEPWDVYQTTIGRGDKDAPLHDKHERVFKAFNKAYEAAKEQARKELR